MEKHIDNYTYNRIRKQAKLIWKTNRNSNDEKIKQAYTNYIVEQLSDLISDEKLLAGALDIKKEDDFIRFDERLRAAVIPFPSITEKQAQRLFKKMKKVHFPKEPFPEITSYLSWFDSQSQRKFIITEKNGELLGLSGTFLTSHKKGICHLCRQESEVGLLTIKGKVNAKTFSYKAIGQYVCIDSTHCNTQITDSDHLIELFTFAQQK